ncbi:MAG: RedB protein [Sandaracinaceae bacterium]
MIFAIAGYLVLVDYGSAPGQPARAPQRWPASSSLPLAAGVPTLLMIIHPRCACTRASIAELARLMVPLDGRVRAFAVLALPGGATDEWRETDLWRSVARIPGITVFADEGAEEADRFGARTSGQVLLYDEAGALRFAGGITPGRSHQGDSDGRRRILDLVGAPAGSGVSAVYGCALHAGEDP